MIIDAQNQFSQAQAVTATGASTNVIDTGGGDPGMSQDQAPWLYVRCNAAYNNLTSLGIKLQSSVDAAFSSPVDSAISITPLLAALTVSTDLIKVVLPIGLNRYLRVYYTVTGTTPTLGSIDAELVFDVQAGF